MAEAPDPNTAADLNTSLDESSEMLMNEQDPEIQHIICETENVFNNFMIRRLQSEIEEDCEEGELDAAHWDSTHTRALTRMQEAHCHCTEREDQSGIDKEQLAKLGALLAANGDEIQHKYRRDFQEMISLLDFTSVFNFEDFAKVARRLFAEGGINMGRIVALFCFGYEIAVSVLKAGIHGVIGFMKKICKFILRFFLTDGIARWISDRGGWVR